MRKSMLPKPTDFWEKRLHKESDRGHTGLCVGYEARFWREKCFVDYIMEWLPEFSLNSIERENLQHSNAVELLRKAAKAVYKTDKFKNRGEFGEIILHAAVRSVFDSIPVISKIYYKSSRNDTVKGFDCVHVVGDLDNLELWIGEVKFYKDIVSAISDVIQEINDHCEIDYLKDEFVLIGNKIVSNDEEVTKIKELILSKKSMDEKFKSICIPVLLTYESDVIRDHSSVTKEYIDAFEKEISKHQNTFFKRSLPKIKIHLFLMPINDKDSLVSALDEKLKTWGSI